MAGRFEACIRLLHVVGPGERTLAEDLLPGRRAELEAFLGRELKFFNPQRVCLIGDDPAASIEKAARNWPADLVMMPTHGRGAFRRMLLGSVTTKVLHDLDCPVWTSVHCEYVPPLEEIHYRNILCAVDLQRRSEDVLSWAAWFACQHDAQLTIVNATSLAPAMTTAGEAANTLLGTSIDLAEEGLARLKQTLNLDCQADVRIGDAVGAVTAAAVEYCADLLIIGRHTGEGLLGRLTDNAYSILRRSPCPVISI
jgi:nucleotide-binding universal stress UspA family protein